MSFRLRLAAAVLAVPLATAAASGAFAQDAPPSPPAPAAPAAAQDLPSPEAVAARMQEIYALVAGDRPMVTPTDDAEARAKMIRDQRSWDESVQSLASQADVYAKVTETAAPTPRGLFHAGYGKARRAEIVPAADAAANWRTASELLAKAIAAAPADVAWRPDALFWHGKSLLALTESRAAAVNDAVARLAEAATALLAAERNDDAGRAASAALGKLTALGMDAEARAFAERIGASKAKFGASDATVRMHLAKASTGVGARFPDLPDTKDADGNPVAWKSFRGAPLVVHFFHVGWATGRPAEEKDVETTLRPLHERLAPRGLRFLGVSMDLALDAARVETLRRNWDEWGLRGKPLDGSRATVARWVEAEEMKWPWLWTGLWMNDPVSLALGGAGRSEPHAILVDKDGIVRWRGNSPFQGLAEAADALLK